MKMKKQSNIYSFSEDGRELIINTPRLPRPWCNYISSDNYGIKFSHTGGGFSVYPILEGRRITKYGENDQSGRYVYIKDRADDELWSLNWQPVKKDLDHYECRHGQGYSIIKSAYKGIKQSLRVFAIEDTTAELWTIQIENISKQTREISIYPYVEWFLGSGATLWDDPGWYTKTEFHKKEDIITASFFNPTKVGEAYTAYFKPLFKSDGFCCSKRVFCGFAGGLNSPEAITNNTMNCPLAVGEIGTGSFEVKLTLAPSEKREFNLVLGYQESEAERNKLIASLSTPEAVEAEFKKINNYWDKINKKNAIITPDKNLNRWINIWLKYQEYQCFRWAGLGEANAPLMGYRDVLQHVMAMSIFEPEMARSRIVEALQHQYNTGRAVRQWSRYGEHDRRDYRDSPVWIVFALCSYLKETYDLAFLDEQVSYLDNGGNATVLEHAAKALETLYFDRGEHGLSHLGEGDWYDPLNKIGRKGRGESIWLSMAVIAGLKEMAALYKHLKRTKEMNECLKRAKDMTTSVDEHAWDGEWYLRAYTDDGEKIGSNSCEEGQIFTNPQVWSIIADIGTKERREKCLASVEEHLKRSFGYAINHPYYTLKNKQYGNVGILQAKSLAYGHVSAFKMFAECLCGKGDAALETFNLIDPNNPNCPPEKTMADPHIIANGYTKVNADSNDAYVLHSGSSGSFPWILKTVIEQMLGARADYDGLVISPCLPKTWKKASIRREFRGNVYNIEINNTNISPQIIVNGKAHIKGNKDELTSST